MKVGFISIFRGFHLNPPSESHTPDSPDSLIFSHQKAGPVTGPEARVLDKDDYLFQQASTLDP
jgi:hypothetical protein